MAAGAVGSVAPALRRQGKRLLISASLSRPGCAHQEAGGVVGASPVDAAGGRKEAGAPRLPHARRGVRVVCMQRSTAKAAFSICFAVVWPTAS